jgi:hypothetical protein
VIYALSQLLRDPDADLPGRQFLARLLPKERWVFGGAEWKKICGQRRDSTAFTAAINYGPSLKTLGWVTPHPRYPRVLIATETTTSALDAFEEKIASYLDHPAFSQFGEVAVTRAEAEAWSAAWALDAPTDAERQVMTAALAGTRARPERQRGCGLMIAAMERSPSAEPKAIRAAMAGAPSNFAPPDELSGALTAWRRVQVRQLFRLSLEALFYWVFLELEHGGQPTIILANSFLDQAVSRPIQASARAWLNFANVGNAAPTALIERIEGALAEQPPDGLVPAIADGIAFCLIESASQVYDHEPEERLPLARARREADVRADKPVKEFICHVIESWVLAQHTYWSIGRGLADARARGKSLLRLKVILEETGWTRAPGATFPSPPVPTADRLQTALTLAREAGLLAQAPLGQTVVYQSTIAATSSR